MSDQTLSVGTGGSSTLLVESEVGAAVNRDHRNSSSQGDENIVSSPAGPCTRDEFGEENSSEQWSYMEAALLYSSLSD